VATLEVLMHSTDHPHGEVTPELPSDFGRHNMFAFGRSTLFLSHFPSFMAPHDTQLVFEATLEDANGSSLQEVWLRERQSHPDQGGYVMKPEAFALSTLYTPDLPARGSFTARFFRSGEEAVPELSDVTVRVTDVVYAKKLDQPATLDDLSYKLFGRGDELFLAHVLSRPPDFDQIVSVRLVGLHPDEDELKRRIDVVFPGRANTLQQRIRMGPVAAARGHVTGAHQFLDLRIANVRELRIRPLLDSS
jgi:hypothetical protein